LGVTVAALVTAASPLAAQKAGIGFGASIGANATMTPLNRVGVGASAQLGFRSLYTSAPLVPSLLLRIFARIGGCHIYSNQDDNVYANDNFLAIYSPKGGDRIIKLPKKATVLNLLDNKTLATGATEFPYTFKQNETILLRLEPQ